MRSLISHTQHLTISRRDIGKTVGSHVSRVMINTYISKLLSDLLVTLKYLKIHWPPELAVVAECNSLNDLSICQLLNVLQSGQSALLWQQCAEHPLVAFRGCRIADAVRDPKTMIELLESHQHHLEWHMARLYRIRCCIVHGSEIRFHLALPAANLEYYLKQTIAIVLKALTTYPHIKSLGELFARANYGYQRTMCVLRADGADIKTIREVIVSDVVIKEHA